MPILGRTERFVASVTSCITARPIKISGNRFESFRHMSTPGLGVVAEMVALSEIDGVIVVLAVTWVIANRLHPHLVALLSHTLLEVTPFNNQRHALKLVNSTGHPIFPF